jgi:hypothetical protein
LGELEASWNWRPCACPCTLHFTISSGTCVVSLKSSQVPTQAGLPLSLHCEGNGLGGEVRARGRKMRRNSGRAQARGYLVGWGAVTVFTPTWSGAHLSPENEIFPELTGQQVSVPLQSGGSDCPPGEGDGAPTESVLSVQGPPLWLPVAHFPPLFFVGVLDGILKIWLSQKESCS